MGVDQLQGRIADRYQLLRQIGRGGSGTVWRAQDLLLQRAIAMKELLPPLEIDQHERRRLQEEVLREARAAARLQHPGAVAVYDVVEEGDRHFIVMELVEAPDLSQVVAVDGPLDPARAAVIGLELLDVLHTAHESGIVHRDVKPGNVLVPPAGRSRLSDFGIASLIDDPSITAAGLVKGTPSYMSPEQAMAGPISPATDMWSLGATLYFAVEGRAPFDQGQPIATLTAIATGEPQPFVRAGPLGPALRPLFAKDPAARPDHEALRRSLQAVAGSGGKAPLGWPAPPTETLPAVPRPPAEGWTDLDVAPTEVRPASPIEPVAQSPQAVTPQVVRPGPMRVVPPTRVPAPPSDPRRALRLVVPAVLAVALLIAGYLAVTRSVPGRAGKAGAPTVPPASSASRSPTTAAPAGWKSYTDPDTGFRLAYPPTWTVVRNGTLTNFRDPVSGTYLRIDHQSPPAPTADGPWYQLEPRFAASNPGYQRIGITRTTFHGHIAAIWEYTYRGGGQVLHAIDMGMIVGDHGFGFNFQTAGAAWAQNQALLASLENAFQP